MKKALLTTTILAVLGISAVFGASHYSDAAAKEATPTVLSVKFDF